MFNRMKEYVLAIILDAQLQEVMLLDRLNEPYKGKLNGIGGKVENNEEIFQAMKRELSEETDIKEEHIDKIEPLINFTRANGLSINVFYIVLKDVYNKREQIIMDEGTIRWYHIKNDNLDNVRNPILASEGGVAYLINYALSKEGINTNK